MEAVKFLGWGEPEQSESARCNIDYKVLIILERDTPIFKSFLVIYNFLLYI